MDGSIDQLMGLLSNRGLEWLRQRIMVLPDPCPADHPDLGSLALAAQAAPVLSGLRGRLSLIEVIVARRMTPALVRDGAIRVVEGARDMALVRLMLAGGLVARDDPVWHLACEALACDPALPLAQRLALSDDPDLTAQAERLLTTAPATVTAGHVAQVGDLLISCIAVGHTGRGCPIRWPMRGSSTIWRHWPIGRRAQAAPRRWRAPCSACACWTRITPSPTEWPS